MTLEVSDDGQTARGLCPNCKVHSGFDLLGSWRIWPTFGLDASPQPPIWTMQSVYRCLHCRQTVSFLQEHVRLPGEKPHEPPRTVPFAHQRVWPAEDPRSLPDVAPEAVRSLFAEGAKCEAAGALRAAGAMYRGAVERLCDDKGASGKNLNDRINDLVNRGATQEIVDDLHEARFLGNWSLHDGLEFSAEEVADVAELIIEAVHVLYVEPAQRAQMRQARKDRRDQYRAAKSGK